MATSLRALWVAPALIRARSGNFALQCARPFFPRRPRAAPRVRWCGSASYGATKHSVLLRVENLRCGGCVSRAEKALASALSPSTGGKDDRDSKQQSVSVSLASGLALLRDCSDPEVAINALAEAGFPAKLHDGTVSVSKKHEPRSIPWELPVALTAAMTSLGLHLAHCGVIWLPSKVISVPAQAVFAMLVLLTLPTAREILRRGWRSLVLRRQPDMDSLVSVGVSVGWAASMYGWLSTKWHPFFHEPVMLMAVIIVGRLLEARLRKRAGNAASQLIQVQPHIARTIQGQDVLVDKIDRGDRLLVATGQRVPVDGIVLSPRASADFSILTGESTPVDVEKGSKLPAGCLALDPITIEADAKVCDSYLQNVSRRVLELQASKAPVQRLADRVTGRLTWFVLATACVTGLAWSFVPGMAAMAAQLGPATALKLATDVVVISCPCGLGLATPMAIFVAASLAAEKGVLFKDSSAIERTARLGAIGFDKTGTLTTGDLCVSNVLCSSECESETVLALARVVERQSSHPIARAILGAAVKMDCVGVPQDDVVSVAGGGVAGTVVTPANEYIRVEVGSRNFIESLGRKTDNWERLEQVVQLQEQGKSIVWVVQNGAIAGVIGLTDSPRRDARATVRNLRHRGLSVALLSGDSVAAALATGKQCGFLDSEIWGGLLPEGKLEVLRDLREESRQPIGFVGDGVNDLYALAEADVGISLRGAADIAEETSDVVLIGSNSLAELDNAVALARQTMTTIRSNLGWALAYNCTLVPIAAGALVPWFGIALSPVLCGAAMGLSSMSVILNSLRLRHSVRKRIRATDSRSSPAT